MIGYVSCSIVSILSNIKIRNYNRWFEYHLIMVCTHIFWFKLFNKVCNIIWQSKVVFLITIFSCLACDRKLSCTILISKRTTTFNRKHIFPCNTIVENNSTVYLKVISFFRYIVWYRISIRARYNTKWSKTERVTPFIYVFGLAHYIKYIDKRCHTFCLTFSHVRIVSKSFCVQLTWEWWQSISICQCSHQYQSQSL